MVLLSRASSQLAAATTVTAIALTLTGCSLSGSNEAFETPEPMPTALPSDLTTTATAAPSATPTTAAPTRTRTAKPRPSDPDAQVIKVTKYDISFELPRGWLTLNAKNVLGGHNPIWQEFADRLGMSQDQLIAMFKNFVQTLSVSDAGAERGFVDNVTSGGEPNVRNDDQEKLGLAAAGAKIRHVEHATSEAGDVTRISYDLRVKSITVHGVALVVYTDDATVNITVSSGSSDRASALANQIQHSLESLGPGTGL